MTREEDSGPRRKDRELSHPCQLHRHLRQRHSSLPCTGVVGVADVLQYQAVDVGDDHVREVVEVDLGGLAGLRCGAATWGVVTSEPSFVDDPSTRFPGRSPNESW